MRRIPQRVIARRHDSEADANSAYYNRGPAKTGGLCVRCGKPEDEHFAGNCNDWGPYTPKKPVEAGR